MRASTWRGIPIPRLVVTLAIMALLVPPASALGAGLASEVAKGRALATSVRDGQRSCGDLSADQIELIGEYAMDRFLGDRNAHEAMNAHMVAMMGAAGEARMHIALGDRFAGCPGANGYGWMGPMIGMMRGYRSGRPVPGGPGPGMMGGRNRPGMMNGYFGAGQGVNGHDHDLRPAAVIAIALGAALLGGFDVALVSRARRNPASR